MSDTPRTDAEVFEVDVVFVSYDGPAFEPKNVVEPDFARELERENTALREQVEQMRSVINEMADRFGHPEFKTRLFDDFMKMRRDLRHERAARAKEDKP